MIFMAPLIRLSECQAKAGGRVYAYLFTPESSLPILRCGHATELPIVFDHPDMIEGGGRGFDEAFAAAMRALWIRFARCGDPTEGAGESPDGETRRWPAYDLKDRYVMVLDEGDIHPEREAELGIVDWERTYFSTRYYWV
jgi:para-nitrobenzyl esterase